jgi:hypothetical protein
MPEKTTAPNGSKYLRPSIPRWFSVLPANIRSAASKTRN